MAMKKRAVQAPKSAKDDIVVYKVMFALCAICIALFALQITSKYYRLAGTMFQVRTLLGRGAVVLGMLAVCVLIWAIAQRKRAFWKLAGVPLVGLLVGLAVGSAVLYATWVTYIPALYFLYIAAFILYLIALLYQPEFFLLSFVNTAAGATFFALSRTYGDGAGLTTKVLLLNIFLVLFVLLSSGLVFLASKQNGRLKIAGNERRIYVQAASPLLNYVSGSVLLVCLIASALLGAVFAYYCVFAAVAFELACAVYYTIKLS